MQAVWEELVQQQEAEHAALPVFLVPVSMVWDRHAMGCAEAAARARARARRVVFFWAGRSGAIAGQDTADQVVYSHTALVPRSIRIRLEKPRRPPPPLTHTQARARTHTHTNTHARARAPLAPPLSRSLPVCNAARCPACCGIVADAAAGTLRDIFSFLMSRSTQRIQVLTPIHVRKWIRSNAAASTQARPHSTHRVCAYAHWGPGQPGRH
jgi:hypothetical protein